MFGTTCMILFFLVLFAILGFNPIGDLTDGNSRNCCDSDSLDNHRHNL